MTRHTFAGTEFAPLYIHSFSMPRPRRTAAEKYVAACSDPSQLMSIADKLKYYRNKKGLRQRDVADYAGIVRSTYASYEKSGRAKYPPDKLTRIAKLLEMPELEILDERGMTLMNGAGRRQRSLPCLTVGLFDFVI